jgi:hypothetical protein
LAVSQFNFTVVQAFCGRFNVEKVIRLTKKYLFSEELRMQKTKPKGGVAAELAAELERLQELADFGHRLRVAWEPCGSRFLAGEVKDDIVFIYEEDFDKALETLRHEFLDFLVCSAVKPYEQATTFYKAMINGLIESLAKTAYLEKEHAVESLLRLFSGESLCAVNVEVDGKKEKKAGKSCLKMRKQEKARLI